ncbi:MAG: adenylate/guanylate cyclase domain-containing protein [Anaerolineales bacterium]|jgi:predicted ATPase/class 3 adenylate cyclase
MGKLPSGTVTFLFTDIESSTKLAQQYPDHMQALLARHNEILDGAIENHDGFLFKTVGDAYCVAFHNSIDALNAALEAQRQLDREAWLPAPIKVRMGIHTGTAKLEGDSDYSGYATLSLVQRIMSAGHGGQVLISETVHDLLDNGLPEDVHLMDMGERNLKDILQPAHLYQLTAPDLAQEFPPLNTLKIINHNLPTNLSSFIGRERELAAIKERFENARLLSLIGPGGTGKTRLSLQMGGEVLSDFKDGVWLVELAPISDPALIIQTIASVFDLRENPGSPLADLVMDYLRSKHLLLILDNCEHLIEACARLADQLLRNCPDLNILASSREALGINGEAVYRVPSLSLPEQVEDTRDAVLGWEAVQLFVDRASDANPSFQLTDDNASSVAQICLRLDGIPLALELAAARVRVLSVEQIAERLDDRFRLLTGGSRTALPRQQTLRALIDWSYALLTDSEKALFRRLAVFVGGWTLEAAEAVCAGDEFESYEVLDLLTEIVDKSLVQVDESGETIRYKRLETIRQYAREKLLETDEAIDVRDRHLDYYIEYANILEKDYINPYQYDIIDKMRLEYDNIRSALSWAVDNNIEKAARLLSTSATSWSFVMIGHISEVRDWCSAVIARLDSLLEETSGSTNGLLKLKARILDRYSQALMNLGNHQASRAAAEESIQLARESKDTQTLIDALGSLGHCALYAGDPEGALEAAKEGIELGESLDADRELIWALDAMTHIYHLKGDDEEVRKNFSRIDEILKKAGIPTDPVYKSGFLIEQAVKHGDMDKAEKYMESILEIMLERRDNYMLATMQSMFAHALRQKGDLDKATFYYRRTIRQWQERGHRAAVAHQLECFGLIAMARERPARAVKLFGAAEALREVSHSVRTPDEQKEFKDARTSLQLGMDEDEFNRVWEEGRSITTERAIEFALEENE